MPELTWKYWALAGSGGVAATASIALTTRSAGMMSTIPSGMPGNSGMFPWP